MKRSSLLLLGATLGGTLMTAPGAARAQVPAVAVPSPVVTTPGDRGTDKAPLYGFPSPYPYTGTGGPNNTVVIEQAELLRQERFRSTSDTRRKVFDEFRYYRMNTPTYEESRQAALKTRFDQAVNNPPLRNIWNGDSLNDLATVIHNTEASTGVRGPTVNVDRDVVRNINWTTDPNAPGAGMVRNGSRDLQWPGLLADPSFAPQRRDVARLLDETVDAARLNSPNARTLATALTDRLGRLREDVRELRFNVAPEIYLDAIGYIRRLGDAAAALRNPGAFRVLGENIQAATVADLLDQMHGRGLQIAAAVPGRESYYTALYNSMSEYQRGLQRQVKPDMRNASARNDPHRFD